MGTTQGKPRRPELGIGALTTRMFVAIGTYTASGALRACCVLVVAVGSASAQTSPIEMRSGQWTATHRSAIEWLGDLTNCGFAACEQSATLAFDAAPLHGLRMSISGAASRQPFASVSPQDLERRADVFVGSTTAVAWGGSASSNDDLFAAGARSTSRRGFEYGAGVHIRDLVVSLSVGSGSSRGSTAHAATVTERVYTFLDSTTNRWTSDTVRTYSTDSTVTSTPWSSTELRVQWLAPRWSVGALMGRSVTGTTSAHWGGIEASSELRTGVTLVLAGGVSSGARLGGYGAAVPRRVASLGLRLSTGVLHTRRREHVGSGTSTAAFRLSVLPDGRRRITVRVANATRVELASDCTAWRPAEMRQAAPGEWTIDVLIAPGVHHLNIRIDGGAWRPPPSLVAIPDDFAGEVGVFVVE